MIVLKLGGSVITEKDKLMTPSRKNIKRLAEEIALANTKGLIIVHGGGSFGHSVAKQYGIAEGFVSQDQFLGFSKTHWAMAELNNIIVDALLNESMPAVSLAPSSFIITDEGRIGNVNLDVVRRLTEFGFLPVLFGDAVLDHSRRFAILSGDQLAARLAIEMRASRLIFGVDTDGVYTSNPKVVPGARLIECLNLEKREGMVRIGEALTTDVTGGMLGKISEASSAVEAGVEVLIVNASKPDVVLKALRGEEVTGTLLTR